MMKISFVSLCLSVVCLPGVLLAETLEYQPVPLLRAAYLHLAPAEKSAERIRLLHEHGFNTALVADGHFSIHEERWRAWREQAAEHDLQVFAVLHFAVPQEFKPLYEHFRPYANRYGTTYPNTPCPLDAEYWNTIIGARFQQFARLANSTPLAGLVFDSEMYGSDISIYGDPCFCDLCWQTFMQIDGWEQESLPADQRLHFLAQMGLWEKYVEFQRQQVQTILARIEQQVHTINPQLFFGFLGYRVNWFYDGLIQGLGTVDRPVLVFSESTYVRGFTTAVAVEIRGVEAAAGSGVSFNMAAESVPDMLTRRVDRRGLATTGDKDARALKRIARYIPGFWLARFFPDDVSAQLYHLTTHTDGYWLYTADSLWRETGKARRYVSLHDEPHVYWDSLKTANRELLRIADDPEGDKIDLPPIPLSSFYDVRQRRLLKPSSLPRFLQKRAPLDEQEHDSGLPRITYRRRTLFHCLNPAGGTIRLTSVPLERDADPDFFKTFGGSIDPTDYMLFDAQGNILREGTLTPQAKTVSFIVSAQETGMISLLTSTTINGTQVSFEGLQCVVEASGTFPLATWNTARSYQFFAAPDKQQIKMRAYCSSRDSAMLAIQSSDGNIQSTTEIDYFTEIRVPLSSNPEGQIQTITSSPSSSKPFGDLRFYFYDEEFPYLRPLNK